MSDPTPPPGGDFRLFVQRLCYQALIGMGIIDNPVTGTRSVALDQARATIADLEMLAEKTQGNLESAEREHLDEVLAHLRGHLAELTS